jgi:hypothetical protein
VLELVQPAVVAGARPGDVVDGLLHLMEQRRKEDPEERRNGTGQNGQVRGDCAPARDSEPAEPLHARANRGRERVGEEQQQEDDEALPQRQRNDDDRERDGDRGQREQRELGVVAIGAPSGRCADRVRGRVSCHGRSLERTFPHAAGRETRGRPHRDARSVTRPGG